MTTGPIDDVLQKVYEGPLNLEAWRRAVDSLSSRVGAGGGAQFHIFDTRRQRMLFSCMPPWQSLDAGIIYNERYAATDPRRHLADAVPLGAWVYDQNHFDKRFVSRSEIYAFLHEYGIGYSAGANLYVADGLLVGLGVFRSPKQSGFDEQEQSVLKRFSPHLVRAAMLTMKLQELRDQASLGNVALDALRDAVIVVDKRCRVVFQNRAAEDLFRKADELQRVADLLRFANADDGRAVTKAISDAVERGLGAALRIRGRDGRPALICRVLLLPRCGPLAKLTNQRAALLVFARADGGRTNLATVAALFGLTAAEARVANLVSTGAAPAEIAAATHVKITTVRSQLAVLFAKTGTRRQAELMRLFSAVPSPREPNSGPVELPYEHR